MCIYIKNNLCKWGLGTRGNGVLQTKNGGGPAYSTLNTVLAHGKLHQWLSFDKNMKLCKLVVYYLIDNISHDAKLNR